MPPPTGLSNVILTGFMGTGKSTVGRLLAAHLGYEFVDTDQLIESRHGTIASIFAELGEAVFRGYERDVAVELAGRSGLVIGTGGRMLLDPVNRDALSGTGRVFCLSASADEILRRVLADSSPIERPLLAGPDPRQRVLDLLAERTPMYRQFEQVATDDSTPGELAERIASLVTADR